MKFYNKKKHQAKKIQINYNVFMFFDNNLIAYEYFKNQYTTNPVYTSGEKDETKLIDKYSPNKNVSTVLILEDDIVNQKGYGLKKGFYNICPDKYLDFLLIYQSGKLKAKIPVVKMEFFETNSPKQFKPEKMSYSSFKRKQEKEYRKYLKGENPSEVEWKEAEIIYIDEQKIWMIVYDYNNIRLIGVIKF